MARSLNGKLVVLCLVVILASTAGLVGLETARGQSGVKTVVVTGAGRMYKNDVAAARERAISVGLLAAVDRVVADHMSMEDRVRHFDVLSMSVYSDIRAYIQGYKVLTEARANKKYHVLMEAAVSDAKVARQLTSAGLLQSEKPLPNVLLLLAERDLGEGPPSFWWNEDPTHASSTAAAATARKMAENGFTIIDTAGADAKAATAVFRYKSTLADTEAVAIGKRLRAQVVVIGEAVVETSPNEMSDGSRTFKATVNARAVRLDFETEIAAASQEFSAIHIDEDLGAMEALSGVGDLAGETLAALITDKWRKESDKPAGVEVIVEGVSNLKNFILFRRTIKELPDVQGVQRKEMTLNEATLFVQCTVDPRTLAKRLMLKTFDSFGLNIYEVTESALKIKLIPNPGTTEPSPSTPEPTPFTPEPAPSAPEPTPSTPEP